MTVRHAAIVGVSLLALTTGAGADEWRTFAGSWSATGTRQTLPTESRNATIARLSGAIVISGTAGLGFTAEAIGFDDGTGSSTGRAVWTDSRGDRIFSALRGGPLESGRSVSGTITGGTGRWADASGEYTMTWQYVVSGEGDVIQGRSADLHGRIRVREAPR